MPATQAEIDALASKYTFPDGTFYQAGFNSELQGLLNATNQPPPPAAPKPPGTTVPTTAITTVNAGSGSPVAQGYELFAAQLSYVLQAEQLRQNAIDQQVNFAKYVTELARVSPTRAADIATQLGIPGLEPDLRWANRFAGPDATGIFGGRVGSQDIRQPIAFSGKELNFFQQNPNVASIISDIGERFGRPDVLANSMASMIPGGANLFKF